MTEHVAIVDSPYIAELNVDLPLGTKLYAAPVVSSDVAALKAELTELKSHNKLIMDMYVQYSDENQSLKTELVNWKSRCEHRVADIQLQAKRVVDLEANMRSLNTELEAVRKDAAANVTKIEILAQEAAEYLLAMNSISACDVSRELLAAIEQAKGGV